MRCSQGITVGLTLQIGKHPMVEGVVTRLMTEQLRNVPLRCLI